MLIYPYRLGSRGVRALAHAIPARIVRRERSNLKGSPNKILINWGSGQLPPEAARCHVINPPGAVSRAADKRQFFLAMEGSGLIPPFCVSPGEALNAMSKDGAIVCRHILQGHSGEGIEICETGNPMPKAPLYVKYVPKKEEFRVHVFGNEVIDIQRKARRSDVPDSSVNWRVRNHQNGFIYARGGVSEWPGIHKLQDAAIRTVKTLALDFGAVDIIWNQKHDRYYVLEVNTAPGLEGATVENYAKAFKGIKI